jgi:nitronate monooxygenase
MDIARRLAWPERYTARVLRNAFTERWHGREEELRAAADEEAIKYRQAWLEGDPDNSNTFIGEAVGLIKSIEPAGEVLQRMARKAEELLSGARPRT